MAFDPELHVIDPHTGFAHHKAGGLPVGVAPPPLPATEYADYPKWIKPHQSRDARLLGETHLPRGGQLMLKVNSPEEERFALSDPSEDEREATEARQAAEAKETQRLKDEEDMKRMFAEEEARKQAPTAEPPASSPAIADDNAVHTDRD